MPLTTVEAIVRVLSDAAIWCGRSDCEKALRCAKRALYSTCAWDKLCALSECLDALPDHSEPTVPNGLIALVACYLRDYFKG